MAWATAYAQSPPEAMFQSDTLIESNNGHTRLSWETPQGSELPKGLVYELQLDSSAAFPAARVLYRGPDAATFVSGLPNGHYYFRVRTLAQTDDRSGSWSDTLHLNVKHHSLTLAFSLLALGGVVVLLTAWMVVSGAYNLRMTS